MPAQSWLSRGANFCDEWGLAKTKKNAAVDSAQQKMSDQDWIDWISYRDRWRAFGEEAALRWMVSKHGQR